jgi:hypothetical protein
MVRVRLGRVMPSAICEGFSGANEGHRGRPAGATFVHSAHDLAALLGVSRTPLRQALLQLARDGVVRSERLAGSGSDAPRRRDIAEMFEIRDLRHGRPPVEVVREHEPITGRSASGLASRQEAMPHQVRANVAWLLSAEVQEKASELSGRSSRR